MSNVRASRSRDPRRSPGRAKTSRHQARTAKCSTGADRWHAACSARFFPTSRRAPRRSPRATQRCGPDLSREHSAVTGSGPSPAILTVCPRPSPARATAPSRSRRTPWSPSLQPAPPMPRRSVPDPLAGTGFCARTDRGPARFQNPCGCVFPGCSGIGHGQQRQRAVLQKNRATAEGIGVEGDPRDRIFEASIRARSGRTKTRQRLRRFGLDSMSRLHGSGHPVPDPASPCPAPKCRRSLLRTPPRRRLAGTLACPGHRACSNLSPISSTSMPQMAWLSRKCSAGRRQSFCVDRKPVHENGLQAFRVDPHAGPPVSVRDDAGGGTA